jgi:hypothetical protein
MNHLRIPIPEWVLRRWVQVSLNQKSSRRLLLNIKGIEPDGIPASILSKVTLRQSSQDETLEAEPFSFALKAGATRLIARLHFMGHYNEPWTDLEIEVNKLRELKIQTFRLEFRLSQPDWLVQEE